MPCFVRHGHAQFFRGRVRTLHQLQRDRVTAALALDPRLVAALRPAMLSPADHAEDQALRDVVLTFGRELQPTGAAPGTVHGTIGGQTWRIACELSKDVPAGVDPTVRTMAVRTLVGGWIGGLWPGGIMPRSRGMPAR